MSSEYKQVNRIWQNFDDVSKKEEAEIKRQPSFFLLYDLLSKKIYSEALKLIEKLIGVQLYSVIDDGPLSNFSLKTRTIATNLVRKKIIKQITKISRIYYDEPNLVQYQAETPTTYPDISAYSDGNGSFSGFSGGTDLDEENAFMKTIGEAAERLCLCVYRERDLVLSTYKEISEKAIDPLSFAGPSQSMRQSIKELYIDETSPFRWIEARRLTDNKKIFVPAQSVYIGYKYHQNEPVIQQQISTGAAASSKSLNEALYKGVCEAVERDTFMITYLSKLSPPVIDIDAIDDPQIQKTLAACRRYKLELYVMDATTDIKIPSIIAVIIDRTQNSVNVHVGCKTSLDMKEALIGVIWETLRGRAGFRGSLSLLPDCNKKKEALKSDPQKIVSFEDRGLFWEGLDMIPKAEFLFSGKRKIISKEELDSHKGISDGEKLKTVVKKLKERNVDIYGLDITMPEIKEEGIWVAKTLSPQLQPLYLVEKTKHTAGWRLFNAPVAMGYYKRPLAESELNNLPHPFL